MNEIDQVDLETPTHFGDQPVPADFLWVDYYQFWPHTALSLLVLLVIGSLCRF